MKVKTSELIGEVLNWAVAQGEKQTTGKTTGEPFLYEHRLYLQDFDPSGNWSHGGPIIEREGIAIGRTRNGKGYAAWIGYASDYGMVKFYTAHNLLTAAMRCYVASKLGDEVEIPDEMIKEK